ncbi:MAG: zinc dependent phospholipase C family protein [Cyclobacteriaceae bacterium]
MAVFTLPPEMIGFYKRNINYITDKAVNPDMRRYIIKEEAPRHYIDLDEYGDSAIHNLPRYWSEAVEEFTIDTLNAYGIVPWHVNLVKYQLTQAFLKQDKDRILRYSADLGHYIADANVPLHTTSNYNGQQTNQVGIHGFWESRLPELFFGNYDLLTGRAEYVENTQVAAWRAVEGANMALDSVLQFEKELSEKFPESKKYSFEERGASTLRVYSYEFSEAYHDRLDGMVERQMKKAIRMLGNFWYTAWVDGGQPDLNQWMEIEMVEDSTINQNRDIQVRNHESGESLP